MKKRSDVNRLAREKSPYLLQHAYNPVDWYPWGEEAFEKARAEDKPVFLSIGYSTCHWCHVMEEESFSDPAVAGLMNEHFVCVKVDGDVGRPAAIFIKTVFRPDSGIIESWSDTVCLDDLAVFVFQQV